MSLNSCNLIAPLPGPPNILEKEKNRKGLNKFGERKREVVVSSEGMDITSCKGLRNRLQRRLTSLRENVEIDNETTAWG